MVSLAEYNSASRMKGFVESIAQQTLERLYPTPRYATVTAFNTSTRTVTVQFPDESTTFTIPCGTTMPAVVGATVRVSGRHGARYVDEIIDGKTTLELIRIAGSAEATLSSTDHPFQIGPSSGVNLVLDGNEVQARNNGASAALSINPHGGAIAMAGGLTITVPGSADAGLILENSSGDANEGGQILFGGAGAKTDWYVDNFNGDLRFFYGGTVVLLLSPTSNRVWTAGDIMMGAGGALFLGGATAAAGPRITSDGSYIHLDANGDIYADGATHWFRDEGGVLRCHLSGTEMALYGTRGFNFADYGGGWYMQDTTWVRTSGGKAVFSQTALHTNGPVVAYGTADNSRGFRAHDKGAYINDPNFNHTNKSWSYATIRLENNQASGNTALVGISFNPANAGIAPIWQCNGNDGEVLQALNNPNTGWIPIYASAFTVMSSERFKDDVEHLADDDVLARAKRIEPVRFRNKIRPQNIRPTAEFADVNARWVESGKTPLVPQPQHLESVDHDCAIDPCDGTAENPCCIALNDTERIGVIAEQVYAVFPEAVQLDADRLPLGVNVDQLAALALTAVGALVRRVEALEAQLAAR